jgi:hypothetical protein
MRALIEALKSTPSDVYKAVEFALRVKFEDFGDKLMSGGLTFTWTDGPGDIVLQASSKDDAKKIKSMLTKGGVSSSLKGTDVLVSHNDYWDK